MCLFNGLALAKLLLVLCLCFLVAVLGTQALIRDPLFDAWPLGIARQHLSGEKHLIGLRRDHGLEIYSIGHAHQEWLLRSEACGSLR